MVYKLFPIHYECFRMEFEGLAIALVGYFLEEFWRKRERFLEFREIEAKLERGERFLEGLGEGKGMIRERRDIGEGLVCFDRLLVKDIYFRILPKFLFNKVHDVGS